MENLKYAKNKEVLDSQDRKILKDYENNYIEGVVILKRKNIPNVLSKRVRVYLDGILTTMVEDHLNTMIDNGFYIVVGKK